MSDSHLNSDALIAFAHGRLGTEAHTAAEQHVLRCESCCDRLRDVDVSVSMGSRTADKGVGSGNEDTGHRYRSPSIDPRPHENAVENSAVNSMHGRFLPGTVIGGRYRIVSLLGNGGMGEVYRADDLAVGQAVALKFLSPQFANEVTALARLQREVRIARTVSHPNVCRIYDIDEAEHPATGIDEEESAVDSTTKLPFISMEYVDGEDLRSLLKRIGHLPQDKGVDIARQLCAGLAAAHEQGILHRDLKPANIMINGMGQVRIADFGLAVIGEHLQNELAGTPSYMAPEQLGGGEHSVRSDIYALGLVLAELFTGQRVVRSNAIAEIQAEHADGVAAEFPHEIDRDVEEVIRQCLEHRAANRPSSVASILSAMPGMDGLEAVLAAGETPSPELLVANRSSADPIQRRTMLTCLLMLLCGVAAMLFLPIGTLGGLIHSADFPLEPAILQHKARETVIASGYFAGASPRWVSEAHGFVTNHGFSSTTQTKQRAHDEYHYWYRLANFPMVPERRLSTQVSFDDPPPFRPGMVELRLDLHGRLIDFHATPAGRSTEETTAVDWKEFFTSERLGMSISDFVETDTSHVPRTSAYDTLKSWRQKGVPSEEGMQLFGASQNGQIVACRVSWPLGKSDDPVTVMRMPIIDTTRLAIVLLMILAVVLAPINVRRGRIDRTGAYRIAVSSVILTLLGWLFGASLTGYIRYDSQTLLSGLQSAVFVGAVAWCFYLALEPFVRRFWPQALVTWTRLLRGKFDDAELGRDVLVGLTVGVGCNVAAKFGIQILQWLSIDPRPFVGGEPNVILGGRAAVAGLFDCALFAFIEGLFLLMFLFAIRLPIKVKGIAPVLFVLFFTAQFSLFSPEYFAIHLLMWIAAALLITRFGLVALICFQFVRHVVEAYPITGDMSTWYAGYSLIPLGVVTALGAYGFYVAAVRRRATIGWL